MKSDVWYYLTDDPSPEVRSEQYRSAISKKFYINSVIFRCPIAVRYYCKGKWESSLNDDYYLLNSYLAECSFANSSIREEVVSEIFDYLDYLCKHDSPNVNYEHLIYVMKVQCCLAGDYVSGLLRDKLITTQTVTRLCLDAYGEDAHCKIWDGERDFEWFLTMLLNDKNVRNQYGVQLIDVATVMFGGNPINESSVHVCDVLTLRNLASRTDPKIFTSMAVNDVLPVLWRKQNDNLREIVSLLREFDVSMEVILDSLREATTHAVEFPEKFQDMLALLTSEDV